MNGCENQGSLPSNGEKVNAIILMPVYDDWEAAELLIYQLDRALASHDGVVDVLLVDDGSHHELKPGFPRQPLGIIRRVEILRLRRNLGHQRAIAVGLVHVYRERPCDVVAVMDCDGEDKPDDVVRLLAKVRETGFAEVVFAERKLRSEGLVFTTCYKTYKILHYGLTGIRVRFGNFSAVPFAFLETLVVVSELWNHYAAAVVKAKLPVALVPTRRGRRLSGRSRMNFVGLVVHGLSALSVFGEIVGVRLLLAAGALGTFLLVLLAVITGIPLATNWAVPAWATYTSALLLVLLIQVLTASGLAALFILANRVALNYLPLRDCPYFVAHIRQVYPTHE